MKRFISALLSVIIISSLTVPIRASSDVGISVLLNGQKIEFDQPPVIIDNRVMVPIRAIFESMDYKVDWNQSAETAVAYRLNDTLTIHQNDNSISYEINGKSGTYICDVPPQNISSRILVPVRAVAESSAYDVEWNGDTRTVNISNYKNGIYNLCFRSDCTNVNEQGIRDDITYGFKYRDDFFFNDAAVYCNDLAVVSLGIALSAFSTNKSNAYYESDNIISGSDTQREYNIINTYNTLGFAGAEFHNYDKSLNDANDKTAYSFAYKNIRTDTSGFTIIPVVIRGGGYGAEWVSNFNLGSGVCHKGFLDAANDISNSLSAYTEKLKKAGLMEDSVRYWVTGYSRGAAVADIAAALIKNDMEKFYASDVFAYCFATPQWINKSIESDFNREYSGIFNIINRGDAIPAVALSEWGYGRVGQDIYLNDNNVPDFMAAENFMYDITGNESLQQAVKTVSNASDVIEFAKTVSVLANNNIEYIERYQQYIMDTCELLCTKYSSDDGKSLSLPEKFQKKYGKTVDDAVTDTDNMLIGVLVPYIGDDYTDTIKCFIALARNDGVKINTQLMLFLLNFCAYYIVNYDDLGINNVGNGLMYAHYPEVYLSWLMCNN